MAALRRPIDLVPGIERTADKASDLRSCARNTALDPAATLRTTN